MSIIRLIIPVKTVMIVVITFIIIVINVVSFSFSFLFYARLFSISKCASFTARRAGVAIVSWLPSIK